MEGSLTAVNPRRPSIKAVVDLETQRREKPTENTRKSQGSRGGGGNQCRSCNGDQMQSVPKSGVHLGLCGCPSGLSFSAVGTVSGGFCVPNSQHYSWLVVQAQCFLNVYK